MKADLQRRDNWRETIQYAWAKKFSLPPNDPRLLRATLHEAIEQLAGIQAMEILVAERVKDRQDKSSTLAALEKWAAEEEEGSDKPSVQATSTRIRNRGSGRSIRTGAEAKSIADTPHLTGGQWPEWDALELEETDPEKPPLRIQW